MTIPLFFSKYSCVSFVEQKAKKTADSVVQDIIEFEQSKMGNILDRLDGKACANSQKEDEPLFSCKMMGIGKQEAEGDEEQDVEQDFREHALVAFQSQLVGPEKGEIGLRLRGGVPEQEGLVEKQERIQDEKADTQRTHRFLADADLGEEDEQDRADVEWDGEGDDLVKLPVGAKERHQPRISLMSIAIRGRMLS